VGPATAKPLAGTLPAGPAPCRAAIATLLQYGLSVVLVSLVLSLVATPWVALPWWKVLRRCVSVGAALSLWLFIRRRERRTIRSYGFFNAREGKRQLLFGLLLGAGTLALMLGLGLASGICRFDVTPNRQRLWVTLVSFAPAALLVGVLEELVFRGFILQHLLACSRVLAVMTSSVLYALAHVKSPTFSQATWLELGGLALLGGVLSLSVLLTKQLYLAVGLHASLAYGARVNKLLIAFPDPSLSWLFGTSRLINGIAGWIVLIGIGGMVVWWVRWSQGGGVQHEQAH